MKIPNLFLVIMLCMSFASSAWALADQEIAEIMMTANDAEIDAAKLAKSRASSSAVKDFAEHMINEHTNNMKQGKKITKDEKIKAKSNEEAKNLKATAKDQLAELKKKKGADFDRAYIGTQVAMHQQLLTDLETKLIPQAQNPQFKNFLNETKTHVEQHLSKAKEIQSSMTDTTTTQ
ncbi:DUF4142 domain-containing protein [Bdellovibrio sp. HCB2-146]|uniref:DUF4142 domain-containing protein n=1 Tax=Bdellovibrio sp. HCB2-146 TaxID=3394362 RepID=UPI0039BC6D1B